jgi:colanic acid/amylovoran biosynthesis protein
MILLHGTGVHNKGAELMAIAILEHFRSKANPPEFAVPPHFGPYRDRARYGVWTLLSERRLGRAKLVATFAHRSFRRKYGLASESDITAVIDASGFAFGDQHGPKPTQDMAENCRRWKRQGKKVMLLPQAFGPFSSDEIRGACRELVQHCDLIFARDTQSLEHLVSTVGQQQNIHLAPDFTNLVPGIVTENPSAKDAVVLVPNNRMIDKTSPEQSARYLPFLVECVKRLEKRGEKMAVLVHCPEDQRLVNELQKRLDKPLPVLASDSPLILKGYLAQARLVVSSRFHALVGALSQGVPAIAVGWSHKYELLLQDYGCREMVHTLRSPIESLDALLDQALSETARGDLMTRIQSAAKHQGELVEEMWHKVDAVLGVGG